MQKTFLVIGALILFTLTNINAQAQNPTKTDSDKKETTTVDAWREALPQNEQPSYITDDQNNKDTEENEETAADIEKKVTDLEYKLSDAYYKRDSVALKQLLADDFMPAGVNLTAPNTGKTQYIKWAVKNSGLQSYVIDKIMVRVFGITAIATVNYKKETAAANASSNDNLTATDVWVKKGTVWQLVSHHISQSPKP